MNKTLSLTLATLAYFSVSAQAQNNSTCGLAENLCRTSLGEYALRLPKKADGKLIPAMIYFHGAGGSGPRSMKNKQMINTFTDRGYAVIAPSGLKRPNTRFGPGWSFLPFRIQQRDEMAFTKELIKDAVERHNVDPERIMLSGFSIGGSLVWYLACQDPKIARAYAPVGGAFWRPHPKNEDCNGPVKLLHTHGWRDGTVPLEGRPLGGGRIYQGDVFEGLRIMREVNGCDQLRADKFDTSGKFWRRKWTKCTKGSALEFALHTRGHSVPAGWAEMAIDWFEELK